MATKQYIPSSDRITLTAPYAVGQWEGALIGNIFGVATYDVASGNAEQFVTQGVVSLGKVASETWAQGDNVYWDDDARTCTFVQTGNTLIGNAMAATSGATGSVRLRGVTQNPVIARPVEVLASSGVGISCALTGTDEVLASFTILAGVMGVNSILQIDPLWTFASSANNKICKVKVGASTVYSATRTTSVKEAPLIRLVNRNSLSSQIQPYDNNYVVAGSGAPTTFAIDFSGDVTVQITGQRAASEALTLEYFLALHYVGD